MHLRLNKSGLEIKCNLAVRVNDRWNSFTKACGMCAVTSISENLDNKFCTHKASCGSNRSEYQKALSALLSVRSSSPTPPSPLLLR